MVLFSEVFRIYKKSLKPADSLFNIYLARPLAAFVVTVLARTRISPNQVTLLSILPMVAGVIAFVTLPGPMGLWLGVIGVELAYILDCADGQLARVTRTSSPVGGELDFLIDELKAYLLIGGLTVRWALEVPSGEHTPYWVGVSTLVLLGSALSLTKFIRTDEYAQATNAERQGHGQAVAEARERSTPLWPVLMAARLISQYPVSLPIFAAFNRMDLFVWAYGVVHMLYAGKTAAIVTIRLGRFRPSNGQPDEGVK